MTKLSFILLICCLFGVQADIWGSGYTPPLTGDDIEQSASTGYGFGMGKGYLFGNRGRKLGDGSDSI
jgi:hypothetical protein